MKPYYLMIICAFVVVSCDNPNSASGNQSELQLSDILGNWYGVKERLKINRDLNPVDTTSIFPATDSVHVLVVTSDTLSVHHYYDDIGCWDISRTYYEFSADSFEINGMSFRFWKEGDTLILYNRETEVDQIEEGWAYMLRWNGAVPARTCP